MNEINITDFLKLLGEKKLNIIDIRPPQQMIYGKIPTSKNISPTLLINRPNAYLNKKEEYYIYCQSGSLSKQVVDILNNKGYHTVNITGGYNNYLLRN